MVHRFYSRLSTAGNTPKCSCPQGDCLYRERIKNWQVPREKLNKNSHEVKADVHFPMSDDVGWLGAVVCSTSETWPRAGTYCPVSPISLEDVSLPCCILISSLPLLFLAAFLDLSSVHQVTGTWMASTTLPCTYVPTEDFTQETLSWSVEQDSITSTIFRRDSTGDHILLSKFRGRVSVPKHNPGDASLLIQNLEMPDSGHYTCQIIWRSRDNSLITKEVTTIVKVVKGKSCSKVILLCSQVKPKEGGRTSVGVNSLSHHTRLGVEAYASLAALVTLLNTWRCRNELGKGAS